MKYAQTDPSLPEPVSSLKQLVINQTSSSLASPTDLSNADGNRTSTGDSIVVHQIAHGVLTGASPLQFMDAINTGNSQMGNRAFLHFAKGLYQQRREMDAQGIATKGVQGTGQTLTHLAIIQQAFGHHDVSNMREYTGHAAQDSLDTLGAEGFSSNGRMAFGGAPDLYTQAHEAAHGVQQAALGGRLQLKGGIGEGDDRYERHADAVADKVGRGESAEGLLDKIAGRPTTVIAKSATMDAPVQMTRKKRDFGLQTTGPEKDDYEWSEDYPSEGEQKGAAAMVAKYDKSTQVPDRSAPKLSENVQYGTREKTRLAAKSLSASPSDVDRSRGMAGKPLLILLEIGQSPQPEMEAEFRQVLGDSCDIRTLGALDHLDQSEIVRYPPESGDDTLFTTLPPDGHPVLISKRLVIDGLRRRMDDLKDIKTPVRILCCTGGFPEIESPNVLMASDIITSTVHDRVPRGSKLGVFVPDKEQVPEAIEQWGREGYEVAGVPLLPEASDEVIEAAAYRMRDLAPDAVLYDCMGYSHELQTKVESICSTTGIIAIGAAAHLAGRLLGIKET